MFDEESDKQQDNQFLINELPEKDRDQVSFSPGAQPIAPMFHFPGSGTIQQPLVLQDTPLSTEESPQEASKKQDPLAEKTDAPPSEALSWLHDAKQHEQAYVQKNENRKMRSHSSSKTQEWIQDRQSKGNS